MTYDISKFTSDILKNLLQKENNSRQSFRDKPLVIKQNEKIPRKSSFEI